MNDEFKNLSQELQDEVTLMIDMARIHNRRESTEIKGADGHITEVYAYPHPNGGISWGVNGGEEGFCIARGIKP